MDQLVSNYTEDNSVSVLNQCINLRTRYEVHYGSVSDELIFQFVMYLISDDFELVDDDMDVFSKILHMEYGKQYQGSDMKYTKSDTTIQLFKEIKAYSRLGDSEWIAQYHGYSIYGDQISIHLTEYSRDLSHLIYDGIVLSRQYILDCYMVNPNHLIPYDAQKITQQLIDAVKYLHSVGLVHRDLKPENVLLDRDNNVKLCDFGLCMEEGVETSTGPGTRYYMPPELRYQQSNNNIISYTQDLWSLGVIVCEIWLRYNLFSIIECDEARDKSLERLNTISKYASRIAYGLSIYNPEFRE